MIRLTIFRYEFPLYVAGWLLAVGAAASQSIVLLELSFLLLGSAGLRRLVMVVLRPERHWTLCSILAGAGMATYYLEGFLTLIQYSPYSVYEALFLDANFPSEALIATAYLSLFCWVLIFLSAFERRFWESALASLRTASPGRLDQTAESAIMLYLLAVSLTQAILMYTGQWTFGGFLPEHSKIPPFVSFVDNLASAIPILCGWRLGKARKSMRILLLIGFALSCEILWVGSYGRRAFFFATMTFLLGYVWAGGRINWKRVAQVAVPALPVVYFAARMFLAMRLASFNMTQGADLETFLRDAWNISTQQASDLAEFSASNYATRLFTIQYLVTVVNELTAQNAQYGLFTFIAFLTNVPRILFPMKSALLDANQWGADGKGIINQVLGLASFDANWSPFVEGFGDFMWLGAIAYPILILILAIVFAKIVRGLRARPYIVGALGMCLMYFIQIETTLGTLIGLVRPLAFLWVFAKVATYARASRPENAERARPEISAAD